MMFEFHELMEEEIFGTVQLVLEMGPRAIWTHEV